MLQGGKIVRFVKKVFYWHSPSFESGLLAVVNEGGDADTNAAISCAILGAKYGYDSIPRYYIENIHNEIEYRQKVNGFIALAINEKEQIDKTYCR